MMQPTRKLQPTLALFAAGLIGLGILTLVYGDFAMGWQPVAEWFPARTPLAYTAGLLEFALGVGLLFEATLSRTVRVLFVWLIVWALLKAPALVVAPKIEGVWLGFGELTILVAGGWVLFARVGAMDSTLHWATGEQGVKWARILFGLSLLPIGLSHFIYTKETFDLVPAWMPFRAAWGYITGAGQMACGLGVLFRVLPRVAAWAEGAMIALFTLLIWLPAIVSAPHMRLNWTAFLISWTIGAAACVVAQDWGRERAA